MNTAFAANRFRARVAANPAKRRRLPFHVFVGYGDLAAMRRAMITIDDTVRESGRNVRVNPRLWRFDQLAAPHWVGPSLDAALSADLVVLASSSDAASNTGIDRWVDHVLTASHGRPLTLVAIFGADAWVISVEVSEPSADPAETHAALQKR